MSFFSTNCRYDAAATASQIGIFNEFSEILKYRDTYAKRAS